MDGVVQQQVSLALPLTASKVDYPNIPSPKPAQTHRNNNNIVQYIMTFLYGQRYPIGFVLVSYCSLRACVCGVRQSHRPNVNDHTSKGYRLSTFFYDHHGDTSVLCFVGN